MKTRIKSNRLEEFERRAFEYGFAKVGLAFVKDYRRFHIIVMPNGEIIARENGKKVDDIGFDIIPKLVWDGFIEKYE